VVLPWRPSHAHFVWPDPTGDRVVVVDLGADALVTFALDRSHARLHRRSVAVAPPGSGPRHLVDSGDGRLLVTGEHSSTVLSFDYASATGEARLLDSVPAGGPGLPQGNHPSNLMLSPDGRYCFVGVRDADVIATFSVRSGRLSHIEDVATLGRDPRHLAVMGRFVYVANRDSGTVVTFELSSIDERLRPTGNSIEVANPCCILGM
jgi:6-phosphogluconolactonase